MAQMTMMFNVTQIPQIVVKLLNIANGNEDFPVS